MPRWECGKVVCYVRVVKKWGFIYQCKYGQAGRAFADAQKRFLIDFAKKKNVDVISVSEPLIEGFFGSLIERIRECKIKCVS